MAPSELCLIAPNLGEFHLGLVQCVVQTPASAFSKKLRRWLQLFYEDRFVLVADGLLPSLIGNRATSFHEKLPQKSTTILIKLSARLCRPKSIANFVTAITAARPTLSYMIR
jgi:hypothetical protein